MGLLGHRAWLSSALVLSASIVDPPVEYTRYKMFELATLADSVLSGEIVDVGGETFDFVVEKQIVGEDASSRVRVQRFENWGCHHRWTKYARGQRLLLFLCRDAKEPSVLRILGMGDEGEMPFADDHVIAHDAHGYRVRGCEIATYQASGAPISGSLMPFQELASAVRGFRDVCSWTKKETWGIATIRPRRQIQEVETFARTSRLARHLFDEARSSPQWAAPRGEEEVLLAASSLRRIAAREHGFSGRARIAPGRATDGSGFELDSSFGAATAFLGDVDGDGIQELAVGAPGDSFLGRSHGAVWILFLDRSGGVRASREIREGVAGFSASTDKFSALGTALAPLGDLNGDAIPDLAVGAPRWNGEEEGKGRGGVWVLFLKRDGSVAGEVELGSLEPLRAAGVGPGFGLGSSLASLGDLDGDGTLELAIGQAPDFELGRESGRSVLIASLSPDGSARRVRRIHDRDVGFTAEYSMFGGSLAGIGDVDGDGVRDLAIADAYDGDGGYGRGCVWVVLLAPDASIKARQKLSDWAGGFEGPLVDYSEFGASLAAPGDVDSDGVPDLVAGSRNGIWTLLLQRDGTVREHYQLIIRESPPAEPPPPRLGDSISCASGSPHDPRPRLAVGIAREESFVWWLTIEKGGRLAAW